MTVPSTTLPSPSPPSRRWACLATFCVLVGATACQTNGDAPPTAAPSATAAPAATSAPTASPVASAAAGVDFELEVDGSVTAVTIRPGAPTLLPTVLPEAVADPTAWKVLGASTRGGRTISLPGFIERYPGHEVRLWIDDQSKLALGVFARLPPRVAPELAARLAKPKVSLVDVTRVVIATERAAPPTATSSPPEPSP